MEYNDIYRNLDCFQSFQNSLIKIIKTYYFGLTCKLTGEADLRVLFFGDKKGNEFTPGEDQDKSKKRITIEFEKDPGKDDLKEVESRFFFKVGMRHNPFAKEERQNNPEIVSGQAYFDA
ncbi:13326_t:CDS:2 [Entrophospora sp. SA101]|nr:13326_t:CDS:2 [Entrophospora sp. SA101]